MWFNNCGWGFPWFGLVFLGLFLFWAISGWRWRRWGKRSYSNSAEDILAEKFAEGSLSEKEYQDKLGVLKKHN